MDNRDLDSLLLIPLGQSSMCSLLIEDMIFQIAQIGNKVLLNVALCNSDTVFTNTTQHTQRSIYTNNSVTVTVTFTGGTLILLAGSAMGRIGCTSILPVKVAFVTVPVTESLRVNKP